MVQECVMHESREARQGENCVASLDSCISHVFQHNASISQGPNDREMTVHDHKDSQVEQKTPGANRNVEHAV